MFFSPWRKPRLSGFQYALILSLILHVVVLFVLSVIQHRKVEPKKLEFLVTLQVHRQEAQQEVAPQVNPAPPPKPVVNRPIKKVNASKIKPLTIPSANDFSINTTPVVPETVEAPVKPIVDKPAAPAVVPTKALNSQILDKSAVANYADLLANHVSQFKYYPRMAIEHRWQGDVIVHIEIAEDGSVVSAKILKSSGYEILDNEAMAMIRKASPLPKPTESLKNKSFSVALPIQFLLK